MTVLYTGCGTTSRMIGNSAVTQDICLFLNCRDSGVRVSLKRITAQLEISAGLLTTVMPNLVGYRTSVPAKEPDSGVNILQKCPFDSSQTSSVGVAIYYATSPDAQIIGTSIPNLTPGTRHWQQSSGRGTTGFGQFAVDDSGYMVPALAIGASYPIYLYPGEAYMIRVLATAAASNAITQNWILNVAWTEETLSTYTINGTVTLSAVGVDGAEVTVVVADDTAMTNAYLHSIQTTAGGGLWSADIPVGKLAFAYAQNYAGSVYYTAPGNPFVTNA